MYDINAKLDLVRNTAAMIGQQVFQQKSLTEQGWISGTILTLFGFTVYNLLVANLIDASRFSDKGNVALAINDALKFTTMYVVKQVAMGGSLTDPAWLKESGYFILSVVLYDLVLNDYVAEQAKNYSPMAQQAINTTSKFSVAFAVHKFIMGGTFNKEYLIECAGFIAGLVVFDLTVRKNFE